MASQIDDFYKDTKAVPVCSGSNQYLVTSSFWSLDPITDMINAVCAALFGTAPVAATGATIQPLDNIMRDELAAWGSVGGKLITANAAFQAIADILGTFSSTTETDLGFSKSIRQQELIPGMSLFICVVQHRYHRQDFFNNDLIIHSFFIYDVRFSGSIIGGEALGMLMQVKTLTQQHAQIISNAEYLNAQVKALDFATYKAQFPKLSDAMAAYKGDLNVYSGMLEDLDKLATLIAARIAALTATARLEAVNAIAGKRSEGF